MSNSAPISLEHLNAASISTSAASEANQSASSASSTSIDLLDANGVSTLHSANSDVGNRGNKRFKKDSVELLRRQLDGRSGSDLLRLRLDPNANETERKTVEYLLYVPAIKKCL